MAKREYAPGLPDPRRFGDVTQLPKNQELLWVIQKHLAERAGPHYDIRFGVDKGNKPSLFSFATRKLPEQIGQKVMMFQQPLHTGQYANFSGKIPSGYGRGTVETHSRGTVIVTKIDPDRLNLAVTYENVVKHFTMIRKSYAPAGATTARQRRTQGGSWLLVNTTPDDRVERKQKLGRQLMADPQGGVVKVALSNIGKLGLGLVAGGVFGTAGFRDYFSRKKHGGPVSGANARRLRQTIGAENIADIELTGSDVDPSSAAYFAPELKSDRATIESWLPYVPELADKAREHGAVITGGRPSLGLLAHEFGHGTGLGAKPSWRYTMHRLASPGVGPGFIVGGIGGALAAGLGRFRGGLAGGLIGAGAQLPSLIEETRANLRARRALKDMGVTDPAAYNKLKSIQIAQTLPIFGSAAAGTGVALLVRALRKMASAEGVEEQAEQIMAPTTWAGLGGEAAFIPAIKTLWHGAKTVGTQFAPKAILKSMGAWLGSPLALGLSTGVELTNTLVGAKMNPDYQSGNISYGQAVRQQLSAAGEAAQLKSQQAFKGNFGTAKGLLSSPLQGIMSPVSTLAGFIQALKHSGKRLVGMDTKKASILMPYIKQAVEAAGGEGTTLQAMVKSALQPPSFLAEPEKQRAPSFLRGEDTGRKSQLRQRFLGWLLGVKPAELAGVSSALAGVGRLSNKVRGYFSVPGETE